MTNGTVKQHLTKGSMEEAVYVEIQRVMPQCMHTVAKGCDITDTQASGCLTHLKDKNLIYQTVEIAKCKFSNDLHHFYNLTGKKPIYNGNDRKPLTRPAYKSLSDELRLQIKEKQKTIDKQKAKIELLKEMLVEAIRS